MKTAGIISEYNPLHLGHAGHIKKTRQAIGDSCAVVCVMSGNFVQRGDFAVFNKHARAKAAVLCGADLVIELPLPYSLSSAEGFAAAGVYILDCLGVCDHLSFGSESGDINALKEAADAIASAEADRITKEWLGKGLPYASARQRAADAIMGEHADVFKTPNNLLGIEYLKAITLLGSAMQPITVKRTGGEHDSDTGFSASALRKMLLRGEPPWESMPKAAASVCKEEIAAGRGPVFANSCELAVLSRLRAIKDFSSIPGASEGLDRRLMRYAVSEPTVSSILNNAKTKRYAMSRLRRMLMCACLGITAEDTLKPPPYIRVLATNRTGIRLLRTARQNNKLPIITKPASAKRLPERAARMFDKEADATDFYALAYRDENQRFGGQEWRHTPVVVD